MKNEWFPYDDKPQVTAVGFDYLDRLPDDVAIIVIDGNGYNYSSVPAIYKRFRGMMSVTIKSMHPRPRFHPDLSDDIVAEIIAFSKQHIDVPLVIQCSAGEQRSQGIASGLYRIRERELVDIPEYPCDIRLMDESVMMAIKRYANNQQQLNINITESIK